MSTDKCTSYFLLYYHRQKSKRVVLTFTIITRPDTQLRHKYHIGFVKDTFSSPNSSAISTHLSSLSPLFSTHHRNNYNESSENLTAILIFSPYKPPNDPFSHLQIIATFEFPEAKAFVLLFFSVIIFYFYSLPSLLFSFPISFLFTIIHQAKKDATDKRWHLQTTQVTP